VFNCQLSDKDDCVLKKFVIGILFFASSATTFATDPASTNPDESQPVEHVQYVNRDGHEVHSLAHSTTGAAPKRASVAAMGRSV
jgi:hypothetical protein